MRILAAADIHGDAAASKKLAEQAERKKADVVVLCGDLTDFDAYGKGMIFPFLEKKKEVLFIAGNHDITAGEIFVEKYKIKDVQHYAVKIGSVGFFGCGTASVGPNALTEKEIFQYISNGFRYIADAEKRVLVTHMRPAGSVIEKMIPRLRHSGSTAIRKAIKKFRPDVNICGHIHEAEDLEERIGRTRVIGVGPEGKIIEV